MLASQLSLLSKIMHINAVLNNRLGRPLLHEAKYHEDLLGPVNL